VRLTADAYIQAGYSTSGTLVVAGSDSLPVVFTRYTAGQYWGYGSANPASAGGLWLGSYLTTVSSLSHCIVEYATSGIYVTDAVVGISDCRIRNNQYHGITFDGTAAPASSPAFANDTITGNGDYPVVISPDQVRTLTGSGSFAGNAAGKDGIYISGNAAVSTTGTWRKYDVPYIVSALLDVGNGSGVTLTLEPGCELRFLADAYLQVGYSQSGTLIADGTALNPITFTSQVTGSYWGYNASSSTGSNGGIWVGSYATNNTSITHAVVEKATSGIYLYADITVTNCAFNNNKYYGIVYASGSILTQTGNTFLGNGSGDTYAQ
jgi:hypothetical protein